MFFTPIFADCDGRSEISFSFIYLQHPAAVLGFEWRKTGRYMPRLVTNDHMSFSRSFHAGFEVLTHTICIDRDGLYTGTESFENTITWAYFIVVVVIVWYCNWGKVR